MKRRILTPKTVVKRPKAQTFRKASTMTRTEQRLSTPYPDRDTLTSAQYTEWSYAVRTMRHYGFRNAMSLSLNDMRDVVRSVTHCSCLTAIHQMQSA